jgi:general secretion pathway protein E
VGEIRDKETAITAVQAAITGHLVFSSIHANDAVSMLARLIDLGVEPSLVASSLIATLAQRMVRRICVNCRTTLAPSPAEQQIFSSETGQKLAAVYQGTGCHLCANTGYQGRTGIFELLVISREIQKMLINNASVGELREQAISDGMFTMKQDGMVKIKEGITTFSEVMSRVFTIG